MLAKFGVMSAFICVGLLLGACSSGDEHEAVIEKEAKERFNARLLSFEETQKEFGLKDKECLKEFEKDEKEGYSDYRFLKDSDGNIIIVNVFIRDKSKDYSSYTQVVMSNLNLDYAIGKTDYLGVERLKAKKPECFN